MEFVQSGEAGRVCMVAMDATLNMALEAEPRSVVLNQLISGSQQRAG